VPAFQRRPSVGQWWGRQEFPHALHRIRSCVVVGTGDDVVEDLTADDLLAPTPGLAAPGDLAELLERLRTERERGDAFASEEAEIGLTSIGVPVRDHAGDLVAAVNISGPTRNLVAVESSTCAARSRGFSWPARPWVRRNFDGASLATPNAQHWIPLWTLMG
jgi:Bacterial transcriptional regulator